MENGLEIIKNALNCGEIVTDYDINEWFNENIDFEDIVKCLEENNITSEYNEKKDTYIYFYKEIEDEEE